MVFQLVGLAVDAVALQQLAQSEERTERHCAEFAVSEPDGMVHPQSRQNIAGRSRNLFHRQEVILHLRTDLRQQSLSVDLAAVAPYFLAIAVENERRNC